MTSAVLYFIPFLFIVLLFQSQHGQLEAVCSLLCIMTFEVATLYHSNCSSPFSFYCMFFTQHFAITLFLLTAVPWLKLPAWGPWEKSLLTLHYSIKALGLLCGNLIKHKLNQEYPQLYHVSASRLERNHERKPISKQKARLLFVGLSSSKAITDQVVVKPDRP